MFMGDYGILEHFSYIVVRPVILNVVKDIFISQKSVNILPIIKNLYNFVTRKSDSTSFLRIWKTKASSVKTSGISD